MNATRGRAVLAAAWLLFFGCGNGHNPGAVDGATGADKIEFAGITACAEPAGSSGGHPAPGVSSGGGGTLRGRVLFKGSAPGRQKAMVVKDVAVCGRINHLDDRLVVCSTGGIQYAVISIKGIRGGRTLGAMGKEFVLDQRTCAYSPHVLLVPKGAELKVLNSDGVLHNIHTFSTVNKPFNIAQPKILKEIKRSFSACERIPVKCDVHGWMSSWVIVVDHPYHAVTDAEGVFEISGIPPGRYTVECWQEELGEQTAEITIGPGDLPASHDFVYTPRDARPKLN